MRIRRSASSNTGCGARLRRRSLRSWPGSDGFTRDADQAAATGALLFQSLAGVDYAWELVASQPAAAIPSYSIVTTTTGDSVDGSNPRSVFAVEARAGTGINANHWWSTPDSGYSVDNLPPAAPAPFTGTYAAGSTSLHWSPNGEADFAHYRLYRGASAGFIPSPSNRVASQPDTGYVDPAGTPSFYKLSAVDVHGNESGYALLAPSGTVDAPGDAVPGALRLGAPQPNPAAVGTRIAFALPTPRRHRWLSTTRPAAPCAICSGGCMRQASSIGAGTCATTRDAGSRTGSISSGSRAEDVRSPGA